MGLRSPFGYGGFTVRFAELTIHLLDNFCSSCHSNKDWDGCENCPIGNLFFEAKEYILNASETGHLIEENKVLREIKKEIKNIEPCTCFNANWIFLETRSKDSLLKLRELVKDLKFLENQRIHPLILKREKMKVIDIILEKEAKIKNWDEFFEKCNELLKGKEKVNK
jgi:hypothetical protein